MHLYTPTHCLFFSASLFQLLILHPVLFLLKGFSSSKAAGEAQLQSLNTGCPGNQKLLSVT